MSLRIVAGVFGGRRLVAPRGEETRPTSERVREALFSILGPLDGLVVLDLYAGTGALGLEALSRGANTAIFVEHARPAQEVVRRNIESLGVKDRTILLSMSAERAAAKISGPVDLVLVDPPYAHLRAALKCLEHLARRAALAADATLVVEHRFSDRPDSALFSFESARLYGDSALSFGTVHSPLKESLDG